MIRSRTPGLIANGTSSYDRHIEIVCATIVSQSGVPAASASVRFSKASRTCLSCASVIVRPWRRRRCCRTASGSEIVPTSTQWLSRLPALSASFARKIDRHWNSR